MVMMTGYHINDDDDDNSWERDGNDVDDHGENNDDESDFNC